MASSRAARGTERHRGWPSRRPVHSTFDVEIKVHLNFAVVVHSGDGVGRLVRLTTFGDMQRGYARARVELGLKLDSFGYFDLALVPDHARKRKAVDNDFSERRLSCAAQGAMVGYR